MNDQAKRFSLLRMLRSSYSLFATILAFSVLLDQITKALIRSTMQPHESIPFLGEWVRITFVYNRGMVFGLKPQHWLPQLPVVAILTGMMCLGTVALIAYYAFLREDRRWVHAGFACIISGAIGNLADRLFMGKVVDFIDMGIGMKWRWPVYNVADAAITVGIAILLLFSYPPRQPAPPPQSPETPET